eukprot:scaffold1225_cov14-Tisochrysis_lutea.AAC.1
MASPRDARFAQAHHHPAPSLSTANTCRHTTTQPPKTAEPGILLQLWSPSILLSCAVSISRSQVGETLASVLVQEPFLLARSNYMRGQSKLASIVFLYFLFPAKKSFLALILVQAPQWCGLQPKIQGVIKVQEH